VETPLPYGPLTDTAVHLCIDMQRMFAEPTPWHVPWMKRVLPPILKIARAWPSRTAFTRFVPPLRAADAKGAWRRYYQRWDEFTGERLDPRYLALLPEFLGLIPPAVVIDKHFYSPFAQSELHPFLQSRQIDAVVITGGETDVCVLAAVLDAVDLGYRVVLASDALCSVSDKAHDDLLQLFCKRFQHQIEVASSETILDAWSEPRCNRQT
jgi:nicotinamidase-related amidase